MAVPAVCGGQFTALVSLQLQQGLSMGIAAVRGFTARRWLAASCAARPRT